MRLNYSVLFSLALLAVAAPIHAYVDDEFNAGTLGPQWTFTDSTPAGSTITLTGTHLRMLAEEKSDLWIHADQYCYIQQDAPTSSTWQIVTKIENHDPTQIGFKSIFERTGIQVWQDNEHWVSIGVLSNANASALGIQAFCQTQPVPLPGGTFDGRYFGSNDYDPVSTMPIYLRIQKTDRGYTGGMSADGINWVEVMARVKNPETVDGSFTNAKIRLYQSGGNNANTGINASADFDYCRAVAIGPLGPTGACTPDEFTGAALDAAKWGYFPGFLGGTMNVGGGTLNLQAGYGNDIWETWERPAYVYQDAPTSNSFVVDIKAGPTDLRSYDLFNEYGIWLWQDQCNWVFIGNQRSNAIPVSNRIECSYKRAGLFNFYQTPDFGTGALPQYLRIVKNGTTLTAQYGTDNTNYTNVPAAGITFPQAMTDPEVRLFTKSVTNGTANLNTPKVVAQFDWFHVGDLPTAAEDWQLLE